MFCCIFTALRVSTAKVISFRFLLSKLKKFYEAYKVIGSLRVVQSGRKLSITYEAVPKNIFQSFVSLQGACFAGGTGVLHRNTSLIQLYHTVVSHSRITQSSHTVVSHSRLTQSSHTVVSHSRITQSSHTHQID